MFSSIFKFASATVRSNVTIGGCRYYPRTNPVSRLLKPKSNNNTSAEQNVEEIDYDYGKESSDYSELKVTGRQFNSRIQQPRYEQQYQEEFSYVNDKESLDYTRRKKTGHHSSSRIEQPRYGQQYDEELNYDYKKVSHNDNERNETELQTRSRTAQNKTNRQYQQNVGDFDNEMNEEQDDGEPEIVELSPDEVTPIREELKTIGREEKKISRKPGKKKDKAPDHDRTGVVEIGENIYKYRVLGRDTKSLAQESLECKSSKLREKNQKIMVEGKRLIYDALTANIKPLKIYFTRTEDLKKFKLPLNIELYKICYEDLQVWSNVKTSQGVIGIFKLPTTELLKPSPNSLPLTIICDQIRDPGNMGSIMRVAAAVGCEKLILTKGCVDVWDAKVLRSGAGAHFRIPIIKSHTWEQIIPKLPDDYSLYLADNEMPLDLDDDSMEEAKTAGLAYRKKIMVSDNVPLGAYDSQNFWGKKSVVLVIGGEAIGLSTDAYQLAIEKLGKRIYIPLSNGVESLNSGVALSVLSYEIRKQYFSEKKDQKEDHLSNNESYQAVGLYSE